MTNKNPIIPKRHTYQRERAITYYIYDDDNHQMHIYFSRMIIAFHVSVLLKMNPPLEGVATTTNLGASIGQRFGMRGEHRLQARAPQ